MVHRALMCRNVLVGGSHLEIRLSGFDSIRELLRQEEYVQTSVLDHREDKTRCAAQRARGWVGALRFGRRACAHPPPPKLHLR